ncbi:MAG: aldo/keto reductase [Deltaproteobacteria bacterium]|nr:aldo/keto reductase [Deltaproteobacteria bacterium]
MIPKRTLGKTGVEVTLMGLGGEGVLRSHGYDTEASDLINRAIDMGINYLESARAYDGSERYYGLALKERRNEIFLTSKSHARDKEGAMAHLEETLRNMHTDHLDLWQVHDVRTEVDIEDIFGPGGAIEAFADAKEKGLTRFIGVTGHQDPFILKRCIEIHDFDTVLMPVNPAEPAHASFIDMVLPVAREKNMGIVAMKVYFRGLAARVPEFESMQPYFRFALSHPVSTAVIGCNDTQQLEENVKFAASFKPMNHDEMQALVDHIAPYATQLMYYKPS